MRTSGWDAIEGGARSRVRCPAVDFDGTAEPMSTSKSGVLSIVTAGAILTVVCDCEGRRESAVAGKVENAVLLVITNTESGRPFPRQGLAPMLTFSWRGLHLSYLMAVPVFEHKVLLHLE